MNGQPRSNYVIEQFGAADQGLRRGRVRLVASQALAPRPSTSGQATNRPASARAAAWSTWKARSCTSKRGAPQSTPKAR